MVWPGTHDGRACARECWRERRRCAHDLVHARGEVRGRHGRARWSVLAMENLDEFISHNEEDTAMRQVWGGIEGGGTKFNCLLGTGPDAILAERTLPTTSPGETLGAVARFFEEHVGSESGQGLAGLGIACFGPIDLNPRS